MPCIKVVNNKKLKIKTDISESYSSRIHLNDEVTIVFPDLGSQLMSHVSHVSQTIDMMTRTFRVEIELPANNQQLRPNMVAQVGIVDYFKKDAIVVPVNAIQRIDSEEFVFVAEQLDGKWIAKKKVVKSGLVYKGQTEILSGLLAGESLITVGFQDLTDNQSIKL
jgi:multidrug efflux pump subunit AcrA (membrane-fusion protein)